jgi:MFS family permease
VTRPLTQRFAGSGRAIALTVRNRNLLRVQLSFGAAWTSEWAFIVALSVVAFRDGGATAVGLIAFLRAAPPALLAPLSSMLADRYRRDTVLVWSSVARTAAIGAAALLLATGAPLAATYVLAVLASCAFIVFRAANSALLPALCTSPFDLTSAMALRGLVDSLSTLVGPLVAALLLSVANPAATFAVIAALSLLSGLLLTRVSYEAPPAIVAPRRRLVGEVAVGFRALRRYPDAAVLIGLALAQTFTRGCLTVFLVVIAFDLLNTGQVGVGVLTAAVGAGATAGSLGALTLVSGRRLAVIEGVGVALWGLPLVLSGAFPFAPTVLMFMAVVGIGNALVDVGLFTLIARRVPENVLGRVYGALESLIALTVAIGSLVTPFVIALLGVRGALVALGLVAPVAAALAWGRLRAIDGSVERRDKEIGVLRQVPLLQPLPIPMIESLAAHGVRRLVDTGADVIRQGETGDDFFVIEAGEADVIGDGRFIRTLRAGECFGEIALLSGTTRTSTVRARTQLMLYVIGSGDFLLAMSTYSASAHEAQTLLRARLADFTPGVSG